jgi:phage antirepressor YoqD-like protein
MQLVIGGVPIRRSEDGLYCINDLFAASGSNPTNRPSNWLRTDKVQALIMLIESEENNDVSLAHFRALRVGKGGNDPYTYVAWQLVYQYAMWISPEFNLKVIQTFHRIQMEEREQLQKDADLYKALSMSSSDMLISEAALTLGIKRQRLFNHLSNSLGWIYKRGSKWWPKQVSVIEGFVARRLHCYKDEAGQHRSYQTVLTERGLTKVQHAVHLLTS